MLKQSPYFHEIADDIYKQLEGCIFIAHNVTFDLNFIKNHLKM